MWEIKIHLQWQIYVLLQKSPICPCLLLSHPLSLALRSEVNHTAALLVEDLEYPTLTVDCRGMGVVIACWKILVSMLLLQICSLDRSGLHSSWL